jgi:hypothetical protein
MSALFVMRNATVRIFPGEVTRAVSVATETDVSSWSKVFVPPEDGDALHRTHRVRTKSVRRIVAVRFIAKLRT